MAIPDVLAAVRTILLGDSAVNTLVSGRVFNVRLPDSQAQFMPRACIVLGRAGGRPDMGYMPVARQRIDMRCYGTDDPQAHAVFAAADPVLKQLRRRFIGNCVVQNAMPEIGEIDFLEQEVLWPVTMRSYLVTFNEVAVA
jgi:hypothetical protein